MQDRLTPACPMTPTGAAEPLRRYPSAGLQVTLMRAVAGVIAVVLLVRVGAYMVAELRHIEQQTLAHADFIVQRVARAPRS